MVVCMEGRQVDETRVIGEGGGSLKIMRRRMGTMYPRWSQQSTIRRLTRLSSIIVSVQRLLDSFLLA